MTTATARQIREAARSSGLKASQLERAYRLYCKRIARCRTENQRNRVHIALENYMTPQEVLYLAAALAGDRADSPSRKWIARLESYLTHKTDEAPAFVAARHAARGHALQRRRRIAGAKDPPSLFRGHLPSPHGADAGIP